MTGSSCRLRSGALYGKGIRKEYRMMTDAERSRFHAAMWTLKRNGEYDRLAHIHANIQQVFGIRNIVSMINTKSPSAKAPSAHSGPAFLPWHREYVKRFEIALRLVDPSISVPYWDTTLEGALANVRYSSLWTNELMGSTMNGQANTGAFRGWTNIDGATIVRNLGQDSQRVLNANDRKLALGKTRIEEILAYTSPQDNRATRPIAYPVNNPQCSAVAHFSDSTMSPFAPLQNIDGCSNDYTDNLYSYDTRRPSCNLGENCGSKFLFCDRSHGPAHCATKIRLGQPCSGYSQGESVCYNSVCSRGVCSALLGTPPPTQPPIRTVPTQAPLTDVRIICSHAITSTNAADHGVQGENARGIQVGSQAETELYTSSSGYMRIWCQASCNICTPRRYNLGIECSDRHPSCRAWAAGGECTNNPLWMRENCHLVIAVDAPDSRLVSLLIDESPWHPSRSDVVGICETKGSAYRSIDNIQQQALNPKFIRPAPMETGAYPERPPMNRIAERTKVERQRLRPTLPDPPPTLAVAALEVGGTMRGSSCRLRSGAIYGKRVRKEYRMITDGERNRFHAAMWTLKRNGEYDRLAHIHANIQQAPSAHSGPSFLPWHRGFEIALRMVDPSISVPYWDTTLEGALANVERVDGFNDEWASEHGSIQRNIDGATIVRNLGQDSQRVLNANDRKLALGKTRIEEILAYTSPQDLSLEQL
ncbi:hypothetical protein PRIPAC_79916 [Pristionchus pacificus]|uniref:ShK domain-containing protein n=1 Tax=Pristionchus pacificus TaxID=54126 RepID=A0A2A6C3B5_PRIPA|nr:hypothetical protein PRIPAC_79916 [Pristionchus pacificus]|eukprot:PDM72664.1 ShK domain-containing protein [Pristionchus pacificus]